MRIEFIGAAHEVTGSCHYLKIGEKHILVDCGMEQGADIYENQDIPVNAAAIAAAVVCKRIPWTDFCHKCNNTTL